MLTHLPNRFFLGRASALRREGAKRHSITMSSWRHARRDGLAMLAGMSLSVFDDTPAGAWGAPHTSRMLTAIRSVDERAARDDDTVRFSARALHGPFSTVLGSVKNMGRTVGGLVATEGNVETVAVAVHGALRTFQSGRCDSAF